MHFNEKLDDKECWEGFENGTQAAAAGGVTTVVAMPLAGDSITLNSKKLIRRIKNSKDKLWVDCGFFAALTDANVSEIASLIACGVLGFRGYTLFSEYYKMGGLSLRTLKHSIRAIGFIFIYDPFSSN